MKKQDHFTQDQKDKPTVSGKPAESAKSVAEEFGLDKATEGVGAIADDLLAGKLVIPSAFGK